MADRERHLTEGPDGNCADADQRVEPKRPQAGAEVCAPVSDVRAAQSLEHTIPDDAQTWLPERIGQHRDPGGDSRCEETLVPCAIAETADEVPNATQGPSDSGGGLSFVENPAGQLILGFVSTLVAEGLIPERKAVSLALQARETGVTFFRMLAVDPAITGVEAIYRRIAEHLGEELISDASVLLTQVEMADWLPFDAAEQRAILSLTSYDADKVRCASVDPFDLPTLDWVARCAKRPCVPVPVLPKTFHEALGILKQRQGAPDGSGELMVSIDMSYDEEQQIRHNIDEVQIPRIINYLFHRAFSQGASDVHLEPNEGHLIARFRIDGILHEECTLPIEFHPPLTSRIKVLADMDLAEKRRPQDGRISARIRDHPIDIRASSLPTVNGEKMVLRLLDEGALLPKLESLGLRENDLSLLRNRITAPNGLIMISGPTGSGKTTTLYSCLAELDRVKKNIVTVEDPVEYRLKGVHQLQINEKIGLSFATGLRTILRQDPDVIMVGECRDVETAAMAIQASLTGHVVLTTIHTNDAVGVVNRLIDMKIDPFLVANAIKLAIAQRLVRAVCVHCRTMLPGKEIAKMLNDEGVTEKKLRDLCIDIDPEVPYPHALGCPRCRNTGYAGRQAVMEMFEITEDCRNLITGDGFNAEELRRLIIRSGMIPILRTGQRLVEEGKTTHAELIRVLGDA